MGDSSSPSKQTVLVTGFGPFATHQINASWEAVKELQQMGIRDDINLVTVEIPVEYERVRSLVPALWKEHSPSLVVHVGVSGIAKELTLEQRAHNDGYDKLDVCGLIPATRCCVDAAPLCLVSRIDMQRVCSAVNKTCGGGAHERVTSVVSHDPGRYLCDFIYFTSLHVDARCSAFIHVPPLDRPYSAKQLAAAIRVAVLAMLDQVTPAH